MQEEKHQLLIILLIVFIGFIGSSIAYPIFPPLFLHQHSHSLVPINWSESARGLFLGIALAAYPLGQFVGSPILGGCSDRYGRKPILIASLAGSAIGYLLTTFSLHLNWLWMLIICRFITGVMEGNFAIVRAMAVELTTISKFKSLGRMNGVSAIGYVTGPLIGGFLSDSNLVSWFSFAFPFFLAAVFSLLALLLSWLKLPAKKIPEIIHPHVSLGQRFNLYARFKILFKSNPTLKYLIIVSTIFTFSVDMFYEFGPVYLTGLWNMTPAQLAVYNSVLSCMLAIGSGLLPYYLSLYFSVNRIIVMAMLFTSIIFSLMVLFPSQWLVFGLFAAVGLSISIANTNLTIRVSNSANASIQGEAMGAQLSLRMLGDAIICLVGGFLIGISFIIPLALSSLIAILALILYGFYFCRKQNLR